MTDRVTTEQAEALAETLESAVVDPRSPDHEAYALKQAPDAFRSLAADRDRLEAERDEALAKKKRVSQCATCGEMFIPEGDMTNAEWFAEHIKVCPDHPMRKLEAQLATAERERDEWKERYETQCAGAMSRIQELVHAKRERDDARRALRLYDAYEATPTDRGGSKGPKGKAWQAFVDAKKAAHADRIAALETTELTP